MRPPDIASDPDLAVCVENIRKIFKGSKNPALDGMSFNVQIGETMGIVGANGAGKTTLMMCLLGLQQPDSGSIRIFNRKPNDAYVHQNIGYMPERLNFEPWLSGREFLSYHWQLADCSVKSMSQQVETLLAQSGLSQASWDRQIRTYSRGMLQRLGIAQALIGDPKILFLDEPTSGIDPQGALEILDIISAYRQQGKTILINSHQLDHLERVCDKVLLVQSGKVAAIEDLRRDTNSSYGLLIRWLNQFDQKDNSNLLRLASESNAKLIWEKENQARFEVQGDQGAARLLAALTAAGLPIFAAKADSRLETFFKDEKNGGKSELPI